MMSLIEDLRKVGAVLDPSLGVQTNEVTQVLSGLVAHIEHGSDVVKAAEEGGPEAVSELLSPRPKSSNAPGKLVDGAETVEPSVERENEAEALRRQVADLQAQLASRQATSQATQVSHNGELVTTD